MTPEALDQANRRLAGAESFTVAPSTYLGHYVAGNLAARHGISVRLDRGRGGHGTVASIDMPPPLLTQDAPSGALGPEGAFEPSRAPLGWHAGRLGPEHALDSAGHAAPAGPGAGQQFWGEVQPAGQEQAEIRRAWDARRAAGG
ncbi:MAG TPA: hypothetical protein VFH36_20940 [Acidimicrobiales bacterium]|nr:hypothetical protein [Acidimicrobiales bacterium]